MPLYEYECTKCKTITETLQSFDVQTIDCKACKSEASRVVSATPGYVKEGTRGLAKSLKKPTGIEKLARESRNNQ